MDTGSIAFIVTCTANDVFYYCCWDFDGVCSGSYAIQTTNHFYYSMVVDDLLSFCSYGLG